MLNEQTIPYARLADTKAPKRETQDESDRWFDWTRQPRSSDAISLVDEVFEEVEGQRQSQPNTRTLSNARKMAAIQAVGCLIANAAVHHFIGGPGCLAITRSKRVLGHREQRRHPLMTVSTIDWLDRLEAAGYLKEQRGVPGMAKNRKCTRILAGSRLLAELQRRGLTIADFGQGASPDVLALRAPDIAWDKRGPEVEIPKTAQTEALRDQVLAINEHLRAADISTTTAWNGRLDIHNRNLRRSFTEGSLECGGRFGGGFWMQMSKADRFDALRINREPVVELDFQSMYPRMAYGLVGTEPPEGDPYVIDGIGREYRRGMKLLMNAMFWAHGPLRRFPRGSKDLMPPQYNVTELTALILSQHKPLEPLIGARVGPRLMYMESTIMTETLLELARLGVAALPIHDALLVARSHVEIARSTMLLAFERIAGVSGRVTLSMRPQPI